MVQTTLAVSLWLSSTTDGKHSLAVGVRGRKKDLLHTHEINDCHFNYRLFSVLCYVMPTFALNY